MKISFQQDFAEATRRLTAQQRKQLPFATAKALTKVAINVRDAANTEIKQVFDRPTPVTQRAFTSQRAEKADYPNTFAVVDLRDQLAGRITSAQRATRGSRGKLFFSGIPYSRYLAHALSGGPRTLKPYERALLRAGILLPGQFTAPAQGVPLDSFGNIPRGVITRILSQVLASPDPAQNRTGTTRSTRKFRQGKTNKFFLLRDRDSRRVGIAARQKGSGDILLVLAFIDKPRYERRLNFQALAERISKRELGPTFESELRAALRTAKP